MSTELIIAMIFLAVFGGYVFTSLLLLKYPNLIHEKKKQAFKCRHISHRGGRSTLVPISRVLVLDPYRLDLSAYLEA